MAAIGVPASWFQWPDMEVTEACLEDGPPGPTLVRIVDVGPDLVSLDGGLSGARFRAVLQVELDRHRSSGSRQPGPPHYALAVTALPHPLDRVSTGMPESGSSNVVFDSSTHLTVFGLKPDTLYEFNVRPEDDMYAERGVQVHLLTPPPPPRKNPSWGSGDGGLQASSSSYACGSKANWLVRALEYGSPSASSSPASPASAEGHTAVTRADFASTAAVEAARPAETLQPQPQGVAMTSEHEVLASSSQPSPNADLVPSSLISMSASVLPTDGSAADTALDRLSRQDAWMSPLDAPNLASASSSTPMPNGTASSAHTAEGGESSPATANGHSRLADGAAPSSGVAGLAGLEKAVGRSMGSLGIGERAEGEDAEAAFFDSNSVECGSPHWSDAEELSPSEMQEALEQRALAAVAKAKENGQLASPRANGKTTAKPS